MEEYSYNNDESVDGALSSRLDVALNQISHGLWRLLSRKQYEQNNTQWQSVYWSTPLCYRHSRWKWLILRNWSPRSIRGRYYKAANTSTDIDFHRMRIVDYFDLLPFMSTPYYCVCTLGMASLSPNLYVCVMSRL